MTLKLNGSTAGSVSIDAPADTSPTGTDVTLTLPTSAGSSGQYLQTNGSGTLSWQTVAADAITEGNTTVECVDTGSNGHITFDTEGSERVRIDHNGNVGINVVPSTSSVSGSTLEVRNVGSGIVATSAADTSFVNNSYFNSGWKYGGSHPAARLQLSDGQFLFYGAASGTANNDITFTERMRIASAGRTSIFTTDTDSFDVGNSNGTGTSRKTIRLFHSATAVQNGTEMFYVSNNGDVRNATGSYSSISDAKLKENIIDAPSQWDDIKALQVRKFNFTEESNQVRHTQIGLIAQEAELVCPGLVDADPDLDENGEDLGTVTKGVKYSVLYMKSVKALQEAMTRIETLETANASQAVTIAALDARLTALEGGAS